MALKDWRETRQGGWTNDKNSYKIRIHYTDGGKYAFYLYDKNWRVLSIKNFLFHQGYNGALKYAKNYMRKN